LIPHKDLQRGLDHFKEFLRTGYPDLQLYREDLYYYYKYVKFNVIQVRNNIVMILHIPLQHVDLRYDLDIYRLHKIPVAVPGSTIDFTMLASDFYAIGYNRDADYGQLPQFLIPHKDLQRGLDHFKEFLRTFF